MPPVPALAAVPALGATDPGGEVDVASVPTETDAVQAVRRMKAAADTGQVCMRTPKGLAQTITYPGQR